MQVVNQNTDWDGGLVLVNSLGFGGVNTTILLKPFGKPGEGKAERLGNAAADAPKVSLPQFVTVSGRTEEGVKSTLQEVSGLETRIDGVSQEYFENSNIIVVLFVSVGWEAP